MCTLVPHWIPAKVLTDKERGWDDCCVCYDEKDLFVPLMMAPQLAAGPGG